MDGAIDGLSTLVAIGVAEAWASDIEAKRVGTLA